MPIHSMTAFGRGEVQGEHASYRCEIKTLNSRFLDTNVRIPRSFIALETKVHSLIKESLSRGKVDITIDVKTKNSAEQLPNISTSAVHHYLKLALQLNELGVAGTLRINDILRFEGVMEQKALSSTDLVERHESGILEATKRAIEEIKLCRAAEGQKMELALEELLSSVEDQQQAIENKIPQIQEQMIGSLHKKLEALFDRGAGSNEKVKENLSEERLHIEVSILADKSDITEEITRLGAHYQEFNKILKQGREVGRKLDFLCQEMHREVNTISNKMTGLEISRHSLDLKQSIEKIRQQIQNIE